LKQEAVVPIADPHGFDACEENTKQMKKILIKPWLKAW